MLERLRQAILRALSSGRAPLVVLVLGILLVSPSISSGLAADDWFHRLVLTGSDALRGIHHRALDLFVFSNGDAGIGRAQQEEGMIGWWADPTTALAFFRPLSAATHWLDYQLFPDAVWLMHMHSLAWFAAALLGIYALYRRLFETRKGAVLAFLLFAIDDAHGLVVSWIANRNALITLALGVPVVLLHDRGRRDGDRRALWIAPLLFGVALLGGESAAAAGAYVLAYALLIDEGPWARRLLSVAPYAVVFVLWRLAYAGLGYGTHGSGLAVDPAADPVGFLVAVVTRFPVLLLAQLAFPPSDLWELFPVVAPWAQPLVYFLSGGVIAVVIGLLRPLLARDPRVRFWTLGTALAVLPACSQVVSDRLLLFTGLGAHAAIASLFLAFLAREEWTTSGGRLRVLGTRVGVAVLVVFHVVIAAAWLPLRARGAADVRNFLARGERTVPSSPDVTRKTVVLVNPPADAFPGYLPMKRATEGIPRPARLRWLATGSSALRIERLDELTLRVRAAAGFQLLASERMQRSPRHPMPVGFKVDLPGMTVLVTDVMPDGRPAEMVARFDLPLEDERMVLLQWSDDQNGFVPFQPPKVGDGVDVARLDYTKLKI